ncbi:hypothetical protein FDT66_01670 [Polaribacter aestuariivivens]|uniref:Uncharacterized protein n=1 Tax=Polaribacter aestuariivivens TaxID=2304626 RepID=A0A5S3NA63_9FLAO|nr:hypothetical protein [Polaribacter aestuariivivens]TMM32198.1 hypothetical protein FDT66_01670 [Polaribacter aestuariivivens]
MKYLQSTSILERGILTSSYKQEIKKSIQLEKSKSISKVKSLITNHHKNIESDAGTILRVALFMVVIVLITL